MIFVNRKGQALIEFVLILPVFLMILFTIVDFGNILFSKNKLESTSSDLVRILYRGKNVQEVLNDYSDVVVTVEPYKEQYLNGVDGK